jgi:malate permease and related proteins
VKAILPLALLVSLGYLLKKLRLLEPKTLSAMNTVSFNVFIPCMIFYNLYNADASKAFNGPVILYPAGSIALAFILLLIFVPLFVKDNLKRGVMVQGIARSNILLMGVPVVAQICSQIGLAGTEYLGLISLIVAVVAPINNVFAILAFGLFRDDRVKTGKMLMNIVKNPLIIASAAGVLMLVFGVKPPDILDGFIADVAGIATPLALILLGGFINFKSAAGCVRYITAAVIGKLIVIPALMLTGAVLLGFRDLALISLLPIYCTPTAVVSFTMAEQLGGDSDLAGHIVIFTTAASAVTLVGWIFLLRQLGLF